MPGISITGKGDQRTQTPCIFPFRPCAACQMAGIGGVLFYKTFPADPAQPDLAGKKSIAEKRNAFRHAVDARGFQAKMQGFVYICIETLHHFDQGVFVVVKKQHVVHIAEIRFRLQFLFGEMVGISQTVIGKVLACEVP
ncbi:MAG: hypothetical protein LBL04_12635, partial [Bacteroidales bacterium]|nr:hypothetical protein [Bacteroidales bacterium]